MKNRNKRAGGASTVYAGSNSEKLFKAVIVILALILILLMITTAVRISDPYRNYTTTPDDLLISIDYGYYSYAVKEMNDNIAYGKTAESNQDYAAPYALLDYFEARSLYTAYARAAEQESDGSRAAELETEAEKLKIDMETARAGMEELEFMTEEIDRLLAD